MTIETALDELGFELLTQRPGQWRYTRKSNPFLQWWVTVDGDGTAELQWEFELGEYIKAKGFHISVQDELSLMIYPMTERRGPATPEWLRAEIEAAEAHLDSVDLKTGT